MNMDPKCMLALIFVSAFEIVNFTKLKDSYIVNSCYTVAIFWHSVYFIQFVSVNIAS